MPSRDDVLSLKEILSTFRPSLIHDPSPFIPTSHKVMHGTFAGMVASALVHPLDVVKTRIQVNLHPYTTFTMLRRIVRLQGVLMLYRGLTASLFRQVFNTGTRLTCYNYLYDRFHTKHKRRPEVREKVQIGLVAGALGAVVGNPSEVILVRMMATSASRAFNKCPDLQGIINKQYYDFGDTLEKIISEEGVRALWRGGTLTVIRSMLNTTCQIGAYASFRDFFRRRSVPEGYFLHVISAMLSSAVFAAISMPVDVVKTRYQMRRRGITMPQILNNVVKRKGQFFFWKRPLPPYYCRLVFHTLTSFFVVEAIENTYTKEEKEWRNRNKFVGDP
ncbi:hypothetical protein O0L34_g73 [Tuta absoluta]|nr:hypothetical protein O0L34_g73 [Tuta absoluta]